jgi:hypothetical protein
VAKNRVQSSTTTGGAHGKREEIPESPIVSAPLPDGAYLLYINDQDKIVPDDKVFARLSNFASLIACYANENVMNSYACAWLNGVECWSVFHDAQQNIEYLETSGILPPEFPPIRDRLFAEQQGDDGADFIFDIPIELFAALGASGTMMTFLVAVQSHGKFSSHASNRCECGMTERRN